MDFLTSPAFLLTGGLPKAGVVAAMNCLEWYLLGMWLLVARTGMSVRDERLLSSPLPSTLPFDEAFNDLERFFAGFIADGGLQVEAAFRLHSREGAAKDDRFWCFVVLNGIGCRRVSPLGGN